MTRHLFFMILTVLLAASVQAADTAMDDVHLHPNCSYCGMDRQMFAHSRMLITYADGSSFGACSLHCAAIDFAGQIGKQIKMVEVADYQQKQLIDAQTAAWVIGGSVKGVMTARPKWAFADSDAAQAFIAENGGDAATFEQAMQAAFEDMYRDTMMIRKKRAGKTAMKKSMHGN